MTQTQTRTTTRKEQTSENTSAAPVRRRRLAASASQYGEPLEPMEKAALSVDEVARLCGLSRTTVFNLTWSGELASVKVGKRRLISRAAVERWLAELEAREATM